MIAAVLFWVYRGAFYESAVTGTCPICGVRAIVPLPPCIAAEQHDGTTHVCHPGIGGCNHGFADDGVGIGPKGIEP